MMATHGLSPAVVDRIRATLAKFPEVERAVLFGSRAKGTHKRGSDIDLALTGAALDWRRIGSIDDALDDLLLPYRFSLVVRDENLDRDVEAHIDRVGIVLYERSPVAA